MGKAFQVGAGNKVKLFVALLPLGSREEPIDVSVNAPSGITASATSITVDALTGDIAGGTPLKFSNGTDQLTVYLTADAKTDDTSLSIEPATVALTGASTANYIAKLRLLGGTQMDVSLEANRTDVLVFEDVLGYMDGAITSQMWQIPWTANLLSEDEAYRRVFSASAYAVSGREVYVWQEDPPPPGNAVGDGLKGATVVTGFQKSLPSDGLITFNCTFNGQGSPEITRFSLV